MTQLAVLIKSIDKVKTYISIETSCGHIPFVGIGFTNHDNEPVAILISDSFTDVVEVASGIHNAGLAKADSFMPVAMSA